MMTIFPFASRSRSHLRSFSWFSSQSPLTHSDTGTGVPLLSKAFAVIVKICLWSGCVEGQRSTLKTAPSRSLEKFRIPPLWIRYGGEADDRTAAAQAEPSGPNVACRGPPSMVIASRGSTRVRSVSRSTTRNISRPSTVKRRSAISLSWYARVEHGIMTDSYSATWRISAWSAVAAESSAAAVWRATR